MSEINERDDFLCEDYRDGKEVQKVARSYGISERRVSQILMASGVVRRVRKNGQGKQPLAWTRPCP